MMALVAFRLRKKLYDMFILRQTVVAIIGIVVSLPFTDYLYDMALLFQRVG